eukprot:6291105-Karenia_brevis.AAC.1
MDFGASSGFAPGTCFCLTGLCLKLCRSLRLFLAEVVNSKKWHQSQMLVNWCAFLRKMWITRALMCVYSRRRHKTQYLAAASNRSAALGLVSSYAGNGKEKRALQSQRHAQRSVPLNGGVCKAKIKVKEPTFGRQSSQLKGTC